MDKYLSVLCYPHKDKQLKIIIDLLNSFIVYCSKQYKISIKIKAISTVEFDLTIHNLLQKFFIFSEKHFKCVDIHQVYELLAIMKNPPNKRLAIVNQSNTINETFRKFFHTTEETTTSSEINEVFHFISLENLKLKSNQGPWGITGGIYPNSLAIVTEKFKEVIYHEFLHQLSVSEGYNDNDYTNTCLDNCWMQYNPTLGNSLCEEHTKELINFIKRKQLS